MPEKNEIGCPLCGHCTVKIGRYWGTCPNGCPNRATHPVLYQQAKEEGRLIHEVAKETYGVHFENGDCHLVGTDSDTWEATAVARENCRLDEP